MIAVIRKNYDKVMAAVVTVMLLASLAYLAARVSSIREMEKDFDQTISMVRPKHPVAHSLDATPYESAMALVRTPFAINPSDYTNFWMFVPARRCICVVCRRPIPIESKECTFCLEPQPEPKETMEDYDGDMDGMWDVWEREHGLNPFDPSDAEKDNDGDKFSNAAEFRGKTDPNEALSYPPLEAELFFEKVNVDPFRLLFKSRITLPGGEFKFGINTRENAKTYFVKIGDDVEGFRVLSHEERVETVVKGGMPRRVDVSVLTLKRGDREIALVKDRDFSYVEYLVHFVFALDDLRFQKRPEDEFSLRSHRYKVIGVDIGRNRVLISRMEDGERVEVCPYPSEVERSAGPGM